MPPSRWAAFAAEAAVPEQLVPYVRAVSDLEPLECGGFLALRSGPALVLVGHDAGLKQGGAEQERSRPEAARQNCVHACVFVSVHHNRLPAQSRRNTVLLNLILIIL